MGCGSSRSIPIQQNENLQMMDMMRIVQVALRQRTAKQAQMVRDDPECKVLLDRQMDLQSRGMQAAKKGDQNALIQIQAEYMELCKNPKYMKMMGQEQYTFSSSNSGFGMPVGGFGMRSSTQSNDDSSTAFGNFGTNFMKFATTMMPQNSAFSSTNAGHGIPMSFMASSNNNFGGTTFHTNTATFGDSTTTSTYGGDITTSGGDSMFDSMGQQTYSSWND
jgi:hypothetical protein